METQVSDEFILSELTFGLELYCISYKNDAESLDRGITVAEFGSYEELSEQFISQISVWFHQSHSPFLTWGLVSYLKTFQLVDWGCQEIDHEPSRW